MTTVADALGNTVAYTYTAEGWLETITDAEGSVTRYTYDRTGDILSVDYAGEQTETHTYNEIGLLTTVTTAEGVTEYQYDDASRLISVTQPGGDTVSYSYDGHGNRISMTYPNGKTAEYVYDGMDRLISVKGVDGVTSTYEYDALGQSTGFTRSDGISESYTYDASGNLIEPVSNIKEGEPFAPPEPVTTDEETSASYYPEGQSNHFGQRHSANAGGVSSLSLHREVFGAFKSKAYSKSAGGLLKQNAKATSGTAVKNSIQKVKQAAARVLNKVSSVMSKGGALANRCGVELSKNTTEKRIGDPSKSPARSLHINRGHFPTRPSPSVKPITKANVSCSAQLFLTGGIPVASAGLGFWEIIKNLFPTMAETGFTIAMIDSPASGPADLAGLGVAFGGTFIIASGIYAYVNWIYPFVTSKPQGPIIILDPTPDIASPQIEVIPKHDPEKGENVIPFPLPEVETGGNITVFPIPEDEGVQIITADGTSKSNPWDVYTQQIRDKSIDVSNWNKGSFDSAEESVACHYYKHGEEVGASSIEQYLRKADGFKSNLRGATTSYVDGEVDGVKRYKKNGRYIDLAPDGSIVSFGKAY